MTAVVLEDFIGGATPTTLASLLAAGATSLSVPSGGLTTWTPVVANRIPVIISHGLADEEHLYATAVSGDSLTGLIRGQDGTTDQVHAAGSTVTHGLFAEHIDVANEFLSMPTAAGQFAQSTAADTWGVTAAPTISDFTNAAHDHGDADDGGALVSPTITGTIAGGPTITAPTINDGTVNLDGGVLIVPLATVPAQTADGSVVWDSNDKVLTVGNGIARYTLADTQNAQTLDQKTLTTVTLVAPTVADFTNAQHDHADTDDGGALGLAALSSAFVWSAYSPSWTAATSNPVIGNGTLTGRYLQVGKLVVVRIHMTAGTTTTFGTGQWRITLPVTPASSGNQEIHGCLFVGAASPVSVMATLHQVGGSSFADMWATTGAITATSPAAWANGDSFAFTGLFEAA